MFSVTAPRRARVGVLVIGRKRPGFDQDWNRVMTERGLAALGDLGYERVGDAVPAVDDETLRRAAAQLRAAGCDALVVLQPSLGNGQLAMTLAQEWSGPIVLWATPERSDSSTVSSCSLVAQHLWGSILRSVRHPFELVYGDPQQQSTRSDLARAIRVSRTAVGLRHAKIGLIGGHAPGFLAMAPDGFLLKRATGAQLHALSLPQFFARVRSIDAVRVREDVEAVRAMGLPMCGVTVDDLGQNSRFFLAMRDVIDEESLDALAVQCWPEFADVEGQWPYLAFSRLADADYPIALEGDVDGAVTTLAGKMLDAGPGFITDWLEHDASSIHFWHPGIAPLRLCNAVGAPDGPSLGRHFNIQKPLVVNGVLQADKSVTVARLWRCDGEYRMMAFGGRTAAPTRSLPGNNIVVTLSSASPHRFDDLLHDGLPHHVVLFFGDHVEAFRRAARMLGIAWHGAADA